MYSFHFHSSGQYERSPPDIPSYLLHGFDIGKGTSRRCRVPRRNPRRWADTGLCCPTWVCPLLPPSPSFPIPSESGSGHPDPGLVSSVSASWWQAVACAAQSLQIDNGKVYCLSLSLVRAVSTVTPFPSTVRPWMRELGYLQWPLAPQLSAAHYSLFCIM